MNTQYQNRQIPLAQRYLDEIHREEVRAREKIIAAQCMSMAASKAKSQARARLSTTPPKSKPIDADIVIHVATFTGNQGPGAWAASIVSPDGVAEESDFHRSITQPNLELEAMIAALTIVEGLPGSVAIHTTTKWIAEYLNNGRVERWRDNGWKKSGGDDISYPELWMELLRLFEDRRPAVASVKSSPEMKKCLQLAKRTFNTSKPISRPS